MFISYSTPTYLIEVGSTNLADFFLFWLFIDLQLRVFNNNQQTNDLLRNLPIRSSVQSIDVG